MISLFQIGTVRLHHNVNMDDLYVDREVEGLADTTQLTWTPTLLMGFGGSSTKVKSITIKEPLLSSKYHNRHQRVSHFSSLVFHPFVDLFAFMEISEKPETEEEYEQYPGDSGVLWLHSTGKVKKVKPDKNELTIELVAQPQWEPINRYNWRLFTEYGNLVEATPAVNAYDDLSSLPGRRDFEYSAQHVWARKFYDDALYMFDADTWEYWHKRLPLDYPITGWGSTWSLNSNFSFTCDGSMWSGLTRSLYQWKNLPDTGTLAMTVSYSDPLWGTRTFTNSIDLAVLDSDLSNAGYTGLLTTDELFIGSYRGLNSFVKRGSTVLTTVAPKWTYTGEVLGQTGKGYNAISCTYPGTGIEMAQLHNFRVL